MDGWLKKDTAATIKFGPFVSTTDGFTPCPSTGGVTLGATDVRLSKAGGDFGSKAGATTSIYDENGYFDVALSTADINTVGELMVVGVTTAAYFAVPQTYMVLPANVYDSLVAGNDYLDINIVQLKAATSSVDDINTLTGKSPSKAYIAGTTNADGDIDASQIVGNVNANVLQVSTNSTAADDLVTLGSKLPSYSYLAGSTSPTGEITATVAGAVTLTTEAEDSLVGKTWNGLLSSYASTGTMGDALNRLDEISTGIATIEAKLPSKSYLTGSSNADGDIDASEVIGRISADMTAISGGTSAADTFETYTNGTTYMPVNAVQSNGVTPATSTEIADAVADVSLALHTSTGTFGDALNRLDEMSTGIASIEAKLPSKSYLTGTTNADGDFDASQVVGDYTGAVGSVTAGITLTTGAADTVVAGTWGALLTSYASTGTMGDAVNRLNEISTGIATVEAKLPSKAYLAGTTNSDGSITADTISGNFAGSVGSVTGAVGSVTAGTTLSTGAEDSLWTWEFESTESVKDYLRISRGALYGVSGGGGTATAVFYGRTTDVARITATVSTAGNRTAVTVDASTL